jgi:integrase
MIEVRNLLAELQEPSRTLVHLLAVTGLRISEARGLKWRDIDFAEGTAKIERGAVGHFISECKNKASRKPVPLAPQLLSTLRGLLRSTEYKRPDDWLFPSLKSNGKTPLWPKSLLEDYVRPAAERAGIRKHLTWHIFRHSFATQLKANGADVKVVQESLRHASSKITLDVYTQAIPSDVRNAQLKIADEITGLDDQENAIVPKFQRGDCKLLKEW